MSGKQISMAQRVRRYQRNLNLRLVKQYRALREQGFSPEDARTITLSWGRVKAPVEQVLDRLGKSRKRDKEAERKVMRIAGTPGPTPGKQQHSPNHKPREPHTRRRTPRRFPPRHPQ